MKKVIPFSPKNGKTGCMLGIELNIESPVILDAVRFYITDYGKPDTQYSYGILRFSNENMPGQEILESASSFDNSVAIGNCWIENHFNNKSLSLSPDKYLIFMKWIIPPGNDGKNAQTIGFQESNNRNGLSWMNWSGQDNDWHKDTGPHIGNFMIEPILKK